MAKRILIRRDTTVNWQSVNPILSNGEFGIEIKTDGSRSVKIGTGSVPWNSLGYLLDDPVTEGQLQTHMSDTSAHSATATPAPSMIAMYNSESGLKSSRAPVESNDVLRKTEMDMVLSDIADIDSDLADETSNRASADAALQTAIDTETSNRQSADTSLQSDIDDLGDALSTEISDRTTAVSSAISTAASDATNKADAAESNSKQYSDRLSLSTQKWLPAVETVDELPADPGGGTYLCRVITGPNYGVYQWIGTEVSPSWNYFSDNLDFIDRIANPTAGNIPTITVGGELVDSGESLSVILSSIATETSNRESADEDLQDAIDDGLGGKENTITAGTQSQYYRGDKTWVDFPSIPDPANDGSLTIQKNGTTVGSFSADAASDETINITLSKSDVGLENVDNTSDEDKPVSTATAEALSGKEPSKYVAVDEAAAQAYSALNPTVMVFYPEV
jgi:hypothetical protein